MNDQSTTIYAVPNLSQIFHCPVLQIASICKQFVQAKIISPFV